MAGTLILVVENFYGAQGHKFPEMLNYNFSTFINVILCQLGDMTTIALKPYDRTMQFARNRMMSPRMTSSTSPTLSCSAAALLEVQPSKLQEVLTTKSMTELQSLFLGCIYTDGSLSIQA